jgi:5'-nucleotidase
MYAQLGAFGEPFDLIVSGINPGQNVGWSVYHSGTIGAALTGRNRGASGLAVSLGFNGKELEGQTWPEIVAGMKWETAAAIAVEVLEGFFEARPVEPVVMNLNVPNGELSAVEGWDVGVVGTEPSRRLTKGKLVEGDTDEIGQIYHLEMDWGSSRTQVPGTDGWLVANKRASLSWLGDLANTVPDAAHHAAISSRLDTLLPKGV